MGAFQLLDFNILNYGGIQGNTLYCQYIPGAMISESPEFGSLRWHGGPNHAQKGVFTKSKNNTLRGVISNVFLLYYYNIQYRAPHMGPMGPYGPKET